MEVTEKLEGKVDVENNWMEEKREEDAHVNLQSNSDNNLTAADNTSPGKPIKSSPEEKENDEDEDDEEKEEDDDEEKEEKDDDNVDSEDDDDSNSSWTLQRMMVDSMAEPSKNPSLSLLVPPDGGWGWLIAFGAFLNIMLVSVLLPCFSILFFDILVEFQASSTTTTWILSMQMCIWHLTGPVAMPFVAEFGWRKVGATGIIGISVSLIISAYTPSAKFLFFSFSLLSGIGSGLVVTLCFNIVPRYFAKRRGTANAILVAGISMGQILGPPSVRLLQEEYSCRGALLVVAALVLNGLVGVALFHPLEWHLKESFVGSLPEEGDEKISTNENQLKINVATDAGSAYGGVEEVGKVGVEGEVRVVEDRRRARGEEGRRIEVRQGSVGVGRCRVRALSESSSIDVPFSAGVTAMYTSSVSISTIPLDNINTQVPHENTKANTSSRHALIFRVAKSTISDLKIMRSKRAIIINVGITFLLISHINFGMTVPFFMKETGGHSLSDASYGISIMGLSSLVTRLILSPLSDYSWFNLRLSYMSGYGIVGSGMLVFSFLSDLTCLYLTMIFIGCGIGASVSLNNLIMIKYMGMEKLAAIFSSSLLFVGLGFFISGPIIGLVRDVTQSYAVTIWIMSSFASCSFLLWFLMPAAVSYDKKSEERMLEP